MTFVQGAPFVLPDAELSFDTTWKLSSAMGVERDDCEYLSANLVLLWVCVSDNEMWGYWYCETWLVPHGERLRLSLEGTIVPLLDVVYIYTYVCLCVCVCLCVYVCVCRRWSLVIWASHYRLPSRCGGVKVLHGEIVCPESTHFREFMCPIRLSGCSLTTYSYHGYSHI